MKNAMLLDSLITHWKTFLVVILVVFFILWIFGSRNERPSKGNIDLDFLKPVPRGIAKETVPQVRNEELTPSPRRWNEDPAPSPRRQDEDTPREWIDDPPGDLLTPAPYEGGSVKSHGEQECRRVVEEIFGRSFPTVRPDFLRNPETGRNLELDCYNNELRLAVEYNGIQHSVYPKFPGQTREAFVEQVRRDEMKLDMCDELGIYVITVPHTVKIGQIRSYIIERIPSSLADYVVDESVVVG